MHCPRCGATVLIGTRFCGSCSASLTVRCRACGNESRADGRFCEHCGLDLASVLPGLIVDRSLAWRGLFQRLGWWESPPNMHAFVTLLRSKRLPADPDGAAEPWLFCCRLSWRSWHIGSFTIDDRKLAPAALQRTSPDKYVLATRCRVLLVNLTTSEVFQALYQDMVTGGIRKVPFNSDYYDVTLEAHGGHILKLRVRTRGPRFIDTAFTIGHTAFDGHHEGEYLVAESNIQAAKAGRVEFLTMLDEFCRDILATS